MVAAVAGCGSPQTAAQGSAKATTTSTGSSDSSTASQSLPDLLKNDAYEYYGLGRKEPTNLVISVQGGGEPVTGSQSVEFLGMDNGKARFKIVRSGKLKELGDETVVLGPEGIVAESVSPGELDGHPMELPANLTPGSTWKTDYKVKQATGETQEDHSTFKVTGPDKVTTSAGTFDAILVESTGDDVLNGSKTKLQTKSWYVKGRGAVKTMFMTTPTGGSTTTMTMEEAAEQAAATKGK